MIIVAYDASGRAARNCCAGGGKRQRAKGSRLYAAPSLPDVFKSLADVLKSLADVFKSLTDVFKSLTDIFKSPTDVFKSLTDIFVFMWPLCRTKMVILRVKNGHVQG